MVSLNTKEGIGSGLINTELFPSRVSLHPWSVSVIILTVYSPGEVYSLFTCNPESNSLLPKSQMVFTIVPTSTALMERRVTESLKQAVSDTKDKLACGRIKIVCCELSIHPKVSVTEKSSWKVSAYGKLNWGYSEVSFQFKLGISQLYFFIELLCSTL